MKLRGSPFFVYCGTEFDMPTILKPRKIHDAVELLRHGFVFLTTVYPTSTTGAHGDNGDKSTIDDVDLNGKG